MEPLTGFGLAVGIFQVLDHTGKLIKTARRIGQSADGTIQEAREIETIASDLRQGVDQILTASRTESDQTFKELCESTREVATDLLTLLDSFRVPVGKSGKLMILRKSIRSAWSESDVNKLQARLDQLRKQLEFHNICGTSVNRVQITQIAADVKDLDQEVAGSQTEPHTHPEILSLSLETVNAEHPTEKSTNSAQPLISINAPRRFQCEDPSCACSCHLGRYLRTPMFLKRFLGALAFRGSCQNHTTSLWELKYWAPLWLSNFNVYVLFERTSCGAPSIGLKFQRKVAWGGDDSIIRFSLVGDTKGIESMLDSRRGSLEDVDPNHGQTALHYAVIRNRVAACKYLLSVGADRFIEDESNMSATDKAWEHILTKRGPPEVLDQYRILFPDDLEYWGFSPLHMAVVGLNGQDLLAALKAESAAVDIHAKDSRGRTPLHWAALREDLSAVQLLLGAGADVHAADEFGRTPLLYAVSSGVPRIVELLILRRANLNVTDMRGNTPLHYAARHKDDLETVKILIHAGAVVDKYNTLGNTPLAGAAITNRVATGRYLLERGADRHTTNKYGDTPLFETIYHHSHEFLQMLLDHGTRYDAVNKAGSSILHAVALEGDVQTVEILRSAGLAGIDTQLKNSHGDTAVEVCQKRIGAPAGFVESFLGLISMLEAAESAF
ncbi:hypothetical protein MFIFM68171_00178 [Madurella fahalii]|uniref:Ankyrin repeat protein n=1 Tax=Madurella fahalii TaxID=1157608 RepID=A0ABQ0FWU2_9PEZI